MPASALVTLYDNPGLKGKSDFLWVSDNERYAFVKRSEFQKLAMGGSIASATLHAPPKGIWGAAQLLLFGDQVESLAGPYGFSYSYTYPNPSGFVGEYVSLRNRDAAVWENWDFDLSGLTPNLKDRVKGLVLVNTNRPGAVNFPVLIRDLIDDRWKEIKGQIEATSDRVSVRGGPYVGWAAKVTGNKYVDPTPVYTSFRVDLWVDLPDPLTKVKANFVTYLRLWADNGTLQGAFEAYTWWRDSAPVVGDWVSGIMKVASELAFMKLNVYTLPPILSSFNAGLAAKGQVLVDVYTLPGNMIGQWLSPESHAASHGSTIHDNDVTVVAEVKKA